MSPHRLHVELLKGEIAAASALLNCYLPLEEGMKNGWRMDETWWDMMRQDQRPQRPARIVCSELHKGEVCWNLRRFRPSLNIVWPWPIYIAGTNKKKTIIEGKLQSRMKYGWSIMIYKFSHVLIPCWCTDSKNEFHWGQLHSTQGLSAKGSVQVSCILTSVQCKGQKLRHVETFWIILNQLQPGLKIFQDEIEREKKTCLSELHRCCISSKSSIFKLLSPWQCRNSGWRESHSQSN